VVERPGSCAVAVSEGKPIATDDIAGDPRFLDGWKALNTAHGIPAIRPEPVVSSEGAGGDDAVGSGGDE
jgi:hypothetical protein